MSNTPPGGGAVNPESLRRAITRLIASETDLIDTRHVDGALSVNDNRGITSYQTRNYVTIDVVQP